MGIHRESEVSGVSYTAGYYYTSEIKVKNDIFVGQGLSMAAAAWQQLRAPLEVALRDTRARSAFLQYWEAWGGSRNHDVGFLATLSMTNADNRQLLVRVLIALVEQKTLSLVGVENFEEHISWLIDELEGARVVGSLPDTLAATLTVGRIVGSHSRVIEAVAASLGKSPNVIRRTARVTEGMPVTHALTAIVKAFRRNIVVLSPGVCAERYSCEYFDDVVQIQSLEKNLVSQITSDILLFRDRRGLFAPVLSKNGDSVMTPPLSLSPTWESFNQRLLKLYGITALETAGDSDCFFHSLRYWITDVYRLADVSTAFLRVKLAADLLQTYPEGPPNLQHILAEVRVAQPKLALLQTWPQYLAALRGPSDLCPSQTKLFGGDLEIGAAVRWMIARFQQPCLFQVFTVERCDPYYEGLEGGFLISLAHLGNHYCPTVHAEPDLPLSISPESAPAAGPASAKGAVTYTGTVKAEARERIWTHAVRKLTEERAASCCVRRSYVDELRAILRRSTDADDIQLAQDVSDEAIAVWKRNHDAIVGFRRPEDLRVLFLAGPEPINDYLVHSLLVFLR